MTEEKTTEKTKEELLNIVEIWKLKFENKQIENDKLREKLNAMANISHNIISELERM